MPRRWGINTRLWAYRYLVLRDGELCARCYEIPTAQNKLDIDHIDGNPRNNEQSNLRLLCRACNVILANKARGNSGQPPSDQRERERGEGQPATRIVREVVNYRGGAAEMQANFLFEVDFRGWLLKMISEKGVCSKSDAIAAGAEIVGCSPATTAKYLMKLTSSAGPLQESRDMLGDTYLTLKAHLQEKPTTLIDLDARTNVLRGKQ